MNDPEVLQLTSSFETALKAAERQLTIARALAAGYRSGVRPPDVVLEAYLARFEADEAELRKLRERAEQVKSTLRVET